MAKMMSRKTCGRGCCGGEDHGKQRQIEKRETEREIESEMAEDVTEKQRLEAVKYVEKYTGFRAEDVAQDPYPVYNDYYRTLNMTIFERDIRDNKVLDPEGNPRTRKVSVPVTRKPPKKTGIVIH